MRRARTLREKKGLSLRDVEREIDVDHTAISKFETEDQGLTMTNLQAYAQLLGVTIDELLQTNGAKPRGPA